MIGKIEEKQVGDLLGAAMEKFDALISRANGYEVDGYVFYRVRRRSSRARRRKARNASGSSTFHYSERHARRGIGTALNEDHKRVLRETVGQIKSMTFLKPKDSPKNLESWRWAIILDGAVKKYPEGREICLNRKAGRDEYKRRRRAMAIRQKWLCSLCGRLMLEGEETFEHENLRGGGHQDDRIEDESGKPMNSACHLICNNEKGSRRI